MEKLQKHTETDSGKPKEVTERVTTEVVREAIKYIEGRDFKKGFATGV